MRRLFTTCLLVAVAMTIMAVPAKRGVWKTLTLADGTTVTAQLVGDEFGHFWKTADGQAYVSNDNGIYEMTDPTAITLRAKARRQQANDQRTLRMSKRKMGSSAAYLGQKKGLILLVNFSDKKFKSTNDLALYKRIANEQGYSSGRFKGSMVDYFKDQSLGQFELDFDIMDTVTLSQKYSYYGGNDRNGDDKHPGEMVCEAISLVKDKVGDWSQYDWDGDGEVDQVYVIYAGYGEADYSDSNTIWPHAYSLDDAKYYGDGSGPVTVATGLKVNTYACGPELDGSTGSTSGIGTMCHEFSHCLGYPDFYDIDYSGGQGMDAWDLMDQGSYNDGGYQPAGYTSYERWVAGWSEPIVLEDEDVTVEALEDLQSSGKSYIIYNKGNRNEYFLLENRQLKGWDASLPGKGLLILHCDYDERVWENNQPNDDPSHQRFTWIPADNKYDTEYYMGSKYLTDAGLKTDTYPSGSNNTFNKDSKPAAKLFNKNTDGTLFIDSSVEDIKQNSNGTIAFRFVAKYDEDNNNGDNEPVTDGILFYESFNECAGQGGNDDKWSSILGSPVILLDNEGWSMSRGYAANACGRFGTTKITGTATTPAIALDGETVMTFRAGAWNSTDDSTTLTLSVDGGSISPATVTMNRAAFKDFTTKVTGNGSITITFESLKGRFFLDEVIVKKPAVTDAISTIDREPLTQNQYYDLQGRRVAQPTKGLYIINGRKVIIR